MTLILLYHCVYKFIIIIVTKIVYNIMFYKKSGLSSGLKVRERENFFSEKILNFGKEGLLESKITNKIKNKNKILLTI